MARVRPPRSRAHTNRFRSDQCTAPQLSTYEPRLGVAVSASLRDNKRRLPREGPYTGTPRWTLYRSGCIAMPGRSISVTMEALCLLLPAAALAGPWGRPMETRPNPRSAAGAAMGPTGGGQRSVGREPGTRLLSHVAVGNGVADATEGDDHIINSDDLVFSWRWNAPRYS